MVISQADFAKMRHVTPSGYAEEGYHAGRAARRRPAVRGPAGIDIPHPRAIFRPTVEPGLLSEIARKAYADWSADQLPAHWVDAVTNALAANVRLRFQPADMIVLRKYGFTRPEEYLVIELGIHGEHRLRLAQPLDLPQPATRFHTSGRGTGEPVPGEHLPFCDKIVAVKLARQRDFLDVTTWPGQVNAREKRWPSWAEIEAAWPKVGAWMAAQRAAQTEGPR